MPSVAYSFELLELFHYLNVECQTSMKGFIEALRWRNNLTETEVCAILWLYCTVYCVCCMQVIKFIKLNTVQSVLAIDDNEAGEDQYIIYNCIWAVLFPMQTCGTC
jgi:hypothetical protein